MGYQLVLLLKVFQSTFLREERRSDLDNTIIVNYFNPRSYVRNDFNDVNSNINVYDFNPRSYVRNDLNTLYSLFLIYKFQSTFLREERPCNDKINKSGILFQSTFLREERPSTTQYRLHAP